ncbi:RluA family pseudouridine synthase [Paenibacillus crassostreae]|uniref:Pseudouridine synthase n=1 Tax=Paenibacillus crassostreae TaxID=1763538 RepID=A0A167EE28_9BACL|nr:RluA family pseudouridine synthase [Paenibacillus crassostreae]AOZ91925.1 RNA pseudouridine synthase [Paenibacillus crassostreae]OAB75444.1 RNA pseudouridine synthase [Paenibacillus crassostreae]
MSYQGSWSRRGEWLELIPGKVIRESDDRETATMTWLLNVVGMPEKLLRRLKHEKGIQWNGDKLRLAIFPSRPIGINSIWQELKVLYEDDFCLVIHKPAGMMIHPDGRAGEVTLDHIVAAHFESMGDNVAVRHIHRLDQHTSGPVLYAKNEWAQLNLDEDMRAKQIERKYVAFVEGKVDSSLTVIDLPIGKDRHHAQRRRVSPTGQSAITHVRVEERYKGSSLIKLELDTGRTHQIRVHLSHLGHPLLGDTLYGGSSSHIRRQALHGEQLCFSHPFTGDFIEINDDWPKDMVDLRLLLRAEVK